MHVVNPWFCKGEMRKEEHNMELLEQHAMGSVGFDALKVALESCEDQMSVEQSVRLFDSALQSLEFAFLRNEIKQIAKDFE